MLVKENKEENLKKAEDLIREAKKNNAEVIALPEMFICPYDNEFFWKYAEEEGSRTYNFISKLAKELKIYIIAGSIPEKKDGRIYNTSFVFDKNGECIAKHQKIHLFDIDIKNQIRFIESEILSPGKDITVFDTEFGKMGIAICYDMRFPELIRLMAIKGAKLIFVPAAFNLTTGPVHWKLTAKSRALDNQIYFAAISGARNMQSNYKAYGHSLVVNPWADVITELDEKEAIGYAVIDFDYVEDIKEQLPLMKHRRTDLYDLKWKE